MGLDLDEQNRDLAPCYNVKNGRFDRTVNTFVMRGNRVVFGGREEMAKEGVEWSVILVYISSELVNKLKL